MQYSNTSTLVNNWMCKCFSEKNSKSYLEDIKGGGGGVA